MMRKRFFIYYMLAFLAAALVPRPAAAQSMSSTSFHVTTQAAESGGSPTSSTSNSLSSTSFRTILNVGRAADNLKTTASLKVREGYIPTLPTPPTFSVTTTTLATAVLNAGYSQTLQFIGGTPPVTWALTFGVLPTGLSLNTSTGEISGVPTIREAQTFVVRATDSAAHVSSRLFAIHVVDYGELVNPGLNTPYNVSDHGFVAEGWQEFTWPGFDSPDFSRESVTILEGDSAQTLSRGNAPWRGGVFQQVPVIPGRPFTASIQAIMASGESGDGNVQIGIGLADGATTDPNLISVSHFLWDHETDLRVFNPFEATIVPTQGFVTVFLAAYNRFAFNTRVTFDAGAAGHDVALKVATSALPPTAVGLSYNVTLRATGGTGPYTWSLVLGTLPAGLSLSSSGTISGVPTTDETQTFTVQVTDSSPTPGIAQKDFVLAVAPLFQISSASPLPRAAMGLIYGRGLQFNGGNPPATWSIVSGSLPPGLTMGNDGIIKGSATTLGTSTFTARATDSTVAAAGGPSVVEKTFSLTVGNVQITSATATQSQPDLAYNPNTLENMMVYQEETSRTNFDIKALRLDSEGNALATPVSVANSVASEKRPRIAYSESSSRFGVVFEADNHVQFAVLDDNGNIVVSPAQVDTSSGTAKQPAIVWRSSGDNDEFEIVWSDNRSGSYALFTEGRSPAGVVVHDDTPVRSVTGSDVLTPTIVHGQLFDEQLIAFSEAGSIKAIRANGSATSQVGTDIILALKSFADNLVPAAVYESIMNRYFVVWQDGRNGASNYDIMGATLFSDGVVQSPGVFTVIGASGIQSNPRVSYNSQGDHFEVVWEHQTDSGDFDIFVREVTMLGGELPLGAIKRVSTPTSSPETETINEFEPAIVYNPDPNTHLVVWRDQRSTPNQIFSQAINDAKVLLPAQSVHVYDSTDFTYRVFAEVFDFTINLNDLILTEMNSNQSFAFTTNGHLIETLSDRRRIEFSVPASLLLGRSGWLSIQRVVGGGQASEDVTGGHDTCPIEIIKGDAQPCPPLADKEEMARVKPFVEVSKFENAFDASGNPKITFHQTDPDNFRVRVFDEGKQNEPKVIATMLTISLLGMNKLKPRRPAEVTAKGFIVDKIPDFNLYADPPGSGWFCSGPFILTSNQSDDDLQLQPEDKAQAGPGPDGSSLDRSIKIFGDNLSIIRLKVGDRINVLRAEYQHSNGTLCTVDKGLCGRIADPSNIKSVRVVRRILDNGKVNKTDQEVSDTIGKANKTWAQCCIQLVEAGGVVRVKPVKNIIRVEGSLSRDGTFTAIIEGENVSVQLKSGQTSFDAATEIAKAINNITSLKGKAFAFRTFTRSGFGSRSHIVIGRGKDANIQMESPQIGTNIVLPTLDFTNGIEFTDEEPSLEANFGDANPGTLDLFVVDTLTSTARGETASPASNGADSQMIHTTFLTQERVTSTGFAPYSLAHEAGHSILNDLLEDANTPRNVMKETTDDAESLGATKRLNSDQCAKGRGNAKLVK